MARRKDRNLEFAKIEAVKDSLKTKLIKLIIVDNSSKSDCIVEAKRRINGNLYRGFDISAKPSVKVKLKTPLLFYPFREFCEPTGWSVMSLDSGSEGNVFELQLVNRETEQVVSKSSIVLNKNLSPILFPYPFGSEIYKKSLDLHMSVSNESNGKLFLAIHRVLDRSKLIKMCKGTGVELGPGLNPQIMPSNETNITYVEQSSPEQWNLLYNDTGTRPVNRELWNNYKIGEAKNIPCDDGSLDFIFSSHVFEHLANPIGYLKYWKTKLKKCGIIAGIVPDVAGCKDYVYLPCAMSDLIQEYNDGYMDPQLHHYERWAKYRAPKESPKNIYEKGRSIHVHFYTARNMAMLLEYAVEELGFSWFNIQHTPNHKDFYFIICL